MSSDRQSTPRRAAGEKQSERASEFTTVSGYLIRGLYSAADLSGWDPDRDLG